MSTYDIEVNNMHRWTKSLTEGYKDLFSRTIKSPKYKRVSLSTQHKIKKYLKKHPDVKELDVVIECTGLPKYGTELSHDDKLVIDLNNTDDAAHEALMECIDDLEANAPQVKCAISFLDNNTIICTTRIGMPFISLCISYSEVMHKLGEDIFIRKDFINKCLPTLEYSIQITLLDNYYHKIVHSSLSLVNQCKDFAEEREDAAEYIKLISDMYNLDYREIYETPRIIYPDRTS